MCGGSVLCMCVCGCGRDLGNDSLCSSVTPKDYIQSNTDVVLFKLSHNTVNGKNTVVN